MITNRKQQILETVMLMLEDKQTLKITTASIAKKLNISEAALYRHFSSKKEIFTQLVDFIETSLLTISSKILVNDSFDVKNVNILISSIFKFFEKNKGLTKIMTVDVLDDNLRKKRVNKIFQRLRLSLKQYLKFGVLNNDYPKQKFNLIPNIVMAYLMGKLMEYSKVDFESKFFDTVNDEVSAIVDL